MSSSQQKLKTNQNLGIIFIRQLLTDWRGGK